VNEAAALSVKGVRQVVRIDEAVAVVADHMWAAKKGLKATATQWDDGANATVDSASLIRQPRRGSKQPGVWPAMKAMLKRRSPARRSGSKRSISFRSWHMPQWSR